MKKVTFSIGKQKIVFKILKDIYQKKRGQPKILLISCKICHQKIALYQKDGPGWLKRCYFDRIKFLDDGKKFIKNNLLICNKCQTILGRKIIYQKERRLTFEIDRKKLKRKKIFEDIVYKK